MLIFSPLLVALSLYGEKPLPGASDNAQIVAFLEATGWPASTHDEVPWCSAFLVWCFKQCNVYTPATAAALSWMQYSIPTADPQLGDIVVLAWPPENPQHHHVGFFIRETPDGIYLLAGNQNNEVDITLWKKADVLSYRRYVQS